jgi:hypothetical protein
MNPGLRVAAFAAGLVVLFGAAAGVGAAVDPSAPAGDEGHDAGAMAAAMPGGHGDEHGAPAGPGAAPGLAVAANGLRLITTTTRFTAGRRAQLRLRIADARGRTVHDFETEHTKRLHLVVVRRDLSGFQHLHPAQAADGSWSVPLTLPQAGVYRVYADFVPHGGTKTVLGTDVFAAGAFTPVPLTAPATTVTTDGYRVSLEGAGRPGAESRLTFTVRRGGAPVAVQPYLGADGHLVTLRSGDLAYLHTHPQGGAGARGEVAFMTTFPTAGRYRLFLQFRHEGRVHTAAFTQDVR